MQSHLANIGDTVKTLILKVTDLLTRHSSIYPKNSPNDGIVFISPSGDHFFNELDTGGLLRQTECISMINLLKSQVSLIDSFFNLHLKEQFMNAIELTEKLVHQNESVWKSELKSFEEDLVRFYKTLLLSFPSSSNQINIVPDTNAFYHNTNIESWSSPNFDKICILLTPTILKELDKHKVDSSNMKRQNKAKTIINKIKEYRRRGKLVEGVTIVNNKISLKAIAISPNIREKLNWLNPDNADDEFIAETIFVKLSQPQSICILVTGDINLQNKCELAEINFIEPLKNLG